MKTELKNFDALSAVQFEEFTRDLLVAMGFQRVDWRKGTGTESSPSDQGRDLEATWVADLPDGSKEEEAWFVECKHHKRGVPAEALNGALAWANAKRPSRLLFVLSNFLANQAKEFLDRYVTENSPPFKISVWELPLLRELSRPHTAILRKHGLIGEFPVLGVLHPCHIRFLKGLPPNNLDYFLGLLESLSPVERREMLGWTMQCVVNPRFRNPPPGYAGTIGELKIDPDGYPAFKEKCYELAKLVYPSFFVASVVSHALQYLLNLGDQSSLGLMVQRSDEMLVSLRDAIAKGDPESETAAQCIKFEEQRRAALPQTTRHHYELYTAFCEKVVGPLFDDQEILKNMKSTHLQILQFQRTSR